MTTYLLRYCDGAGRPFAVHDIDATDDDDAIGRAHAQAKWDLPCFELVDDARIVYRTMALRTIKSAESGGGVARRSPLSEIATPSAPPALERHRQPDEVRPVLHSAERARR